MPEDMQNLPEPETVQTEPETELQEINTNPVSVDYTDTLNTIDSNLNSLTSEVSSWISEQRLQQISDQEIEPETSLLETEPLETEVPVYKDSIEKLVISLGNIDKSLKDVNKKLDVSYSAKIQDLTVQIEVANKFISRLYFLGFLTLALLIGITIYKLISHTVTDHM